MNDKTEAQRMPEYTPAGWGLFIGGILSVTDATEDGALRSKKAIESMVKTTAPIEVRQLFSRDAK